MYFCNLLIFIKKIKNTPQIYFLQVLYKTVGYKKRGKTMNIQPINNTMTRNTINNQISFKDLEDDFEFKMKTPYQCAMEKLDRKFEEQLKILEKSYPDKSCRERAIALDKLWAWKESAEVTIKENFGIIKRRNFFQRLFRIK